MKKPRPKSQRASAIKDRAAKTAQVVSPASPVAAEAPKEKKAFNPIQFVNEVRAEGRKITWTSRKETWITSVMVAIMVALAAVFFWIVNMILQFGITQLLKISTGG